jgi:hypothetical protein
MLYMCDEAAFVDETTHTRHYPASRSQVRELAESILSVVENIFGSVASSAQAVVEILSRPETSAKRGEKRSERSRARCHVCKLAFSFFRLRRWRENFFTSLGDGRKKSAQDQATERGAFDIFIC